MVSTRSLLHFRSALLLMAMAGAAGSLQAQNTQAAQLLNQGQVGEAAAILNGTLAKQPHDAQAHQLLCRVDYAQDLAEAAVHECELAALDDPSSSTNQVWLGRAYGLQASQASMFSAFGIAKKVHTAFERAIQLDPANVEAMSDLGQFYVAAPSIVGGGTERAEALAGRLMPLSAARGHRLLGQIAAKKSDPGTAEAEFKSAVAAARSPEAWVDLGLFYYQRGQPDKAVAALQSSIEANRRKTSALVDAASILTDLKREPELAERSLRDYLASSAKTDEAPAFKVHLQLGDLLKRRGDLSGAKQEYDTAVALASKYVPAQRAAQGT